MPLDQEDDPLVGEKDMSFLDHLEELRWHIVRSVIAIMVFTIFAFVTAPWIFENIIFAPARVDFPTFKALCRFGDLVGAESLCVKEMPFKIQSRNMTGQFTMHIFASFIIGFIIAFPYIAWELWRFIRPALYSKERNYSRGAVASISFLFISGILFGYYVLSPLVVSFLANYQISDMISNEFDITSYVSTVVGMVLGCGVLFQLPVVIYFLSKIGLVTPMFLRTYRKHAIVIILITGAIVTPSSDPFSQMLISFPLYLLYEISILISANVYKKKLKEEAEELLKEQKS
jgi:sec-independent protein translocase protein TatC